MTGLRDAQTAGKTLFLGVFEGVFLEEISICVGRMSVEGCPHRCGWVTSNPLRVQIEPKGGGMVNVLSS